MTARHHEQKTPQTHAEQIIDKLRQAEELKSPKDENAGLKQLLAETEREKDALKFIA